MAFGRAPAYPQQLQTALTAAGFKWEVASYEADSQLAWLAITGRVQYVLSDDADLVALGYPRVLRALDAFNGTADLVEHARVVGNLHRQRGRLAERPQAW